jgi:hypothetical protein
MRKGPLRASLASVTNSAHLQLPSSQGGRRQVTGAHWLLLLLLQHQQTGQELSAPEQWHLQCICVTCWTAWHPQGERK